MANLTSTSSRKIKIKIIKPEWKTIGHINYVEHEFKNTNCKISFK